MSQKMKSSLQEDGRKRKIVIKNGFTPSSWMQYFINGVKNGDCVIWDDIMYSPYGAVPWIIMVRGT